MKKLIILSVFLISLSNFFGTEMIYTYLGPLNNNLAVASNEDNKWGYVNVEGKVIIPFKYDAAYSFNNGVAVVGIGLGMTKMYLIDTEGNQITKKQYDEIYTNDDDDDYNINKNKFFFEVKDNYKFGLISKTGKEIFPTIYDNISLYINDKIIRVEKNGEVFYSDNVGKEVKFPLKNIDFVKQLEDSLYSFTLDGDAVIYNKKNNKILSKKYSEISDFYIDKAIAWKGNNSYIIDKSGNQLIEIKDKRIRPVLDKYLIVDSKKIGAIDWEGKKILPEIYDELLYNGNETFTYKTNGKYEKYGVLDISTKNTLDNIFDGISYLKNDFYLTIRKDENYSSIYALFDKNFNKVFEKEYSMMQSFSEGYFIIVDSKREEIGFVDMNGKEIWIGKIGELISSMNYNEVDYEEDKDFE